MDARTGARRDPSWSQRDRPPLGYTLNRLAVGLQEITGAGPPHQTYDGWAGRVLIDRSPGGSVRTGLPDPPLPDNAVSYAQGYVEQRGVLQTNRPPAPTDADAQRYYWDYHLGRIMP